LANFVIRGEDESSAWELAERIGSMLLEGRSLHSSPSRMRVLGPAPAPIQKLKRDFRFQILVKTTNRLELHEVLKTAVSGLNRKESRGVLIDVDPTSLL
jgi:primosomal protein N' (replication factor Y)